MGDPGGTEEALQPADAEQPADENRRSVRRAILEELDGQRRRSPLRHEIEGRIELAGFLKSHGIDQATYLVNAVQLRAERLISQPQFDQATLEDGYAFITPAGIAWLEWSRSAGAHPAEAPLPSGTLTFLMTDVADNTELFEKDPDGMRASLARHDSELQKIVESHSGRLLKHKGEGDSSFTVFTTPTQAVTAAVEAQRAFGLPGWPVPLRVRMGLATGEAEAEDGDYRGSLPNLCGRIKSEAKGGQVLLAEATARLAKMPAGCELRRLGERHLKGFDKPETLSEVVLSGSSGAEDRPDTGPRRGFDAAITLHRDLVRLSVVNRSKASDFEAQVTDVHGADRALDVPLPWSPRWHGEPARRAHVLNGQAAVIDLLTLSRDAAQQILYGHATAAPYLLHKVDGDTPVFFPLDASNWSAVPELCVTVRIWRVDGPEMADIYVRVGFDSPPSVSDTPCAGVGAVEAARRNAERDLARHRAGTRVDELVRARFGGFHLEPMELRNLSAAVWLDIEVPGFASTYPLVEESGGLLMHFAGGWTGMAVVADRTEATLQRIAEVHRQLVAEVRTWPDIAPRR